MRAAELDDQGLDPAVFRVRVGEGESEDGEFGVAVRGLPMRRLENAGMAKIGSACLYFLIASIGMQMDFMQLADRPWLLALGAVWMLVHILVLWGAAKLVRAPLFYFAIGSQGNIGAAASAPVVAAAFHPTLAPVGVLLGTIGYATGTLIAYWVGQVLRLMAGQ